MIKRLLLICALAGTAFGQSVVTAPTGNQIIQPVAPNITPTFNVRSIP